jgi:hypothetical protein
VEGDIPLMSAVKATSKSIKFSIKGFEVLKQ